MVGTSDAWCLSRVNRRCHILSTATDTATSQGHIVRRQGNYTITTKHGHVDGTEVRSNGNAAEYNYLLLP